MATVQYAAHIHQIRGSMGNATYSRNRPGNFMRTRVVPHDPATLPQLEQRNLHAFVVDYWRNTLSDAQRLVWNDLALITDFHSPTCRSYHPSGFSLFLRANVFRVNTLSAVEVVPDAVATSPPTPFDVGSGAVAGRSYITADYDWHDGKTGKVFAWFSPDVSQSTYYYRGPWPSFWCFNINALAALPYALGATNVLADGFRRWIRFKAWFGTQGTILTYFQHAYWDRND